MSLLGLRTFFFKTKAVARGDFKCSHPVRSMSWKKNQTTFWIRETQNVASSLTADGDTAQGSSCWRWKLTPSSLEGLSGSSRSTPTGSSRHHWTSLWWLNMMIGASCQCNSSNVLLRFNICYSNTFFPMKFKCKWFKFSFMVYFTFVWTVHILPCAHIQKPACWLQLPERFLKRPRGFRSSGRCDIPALAPAVGAGTPAAKQK